MNLYELTSTYQDIQDRIENGEDLEGLLETIDGLFDEKVDGYVKVIKNIQAEAEALKAEEARLKEKRTYRENAVDRMKKSLFESFKATGKDSVQTDLFKVSIQKNGGKTPIILDCDVEDLPDHFCRIKREADIEALREELETMGKSSYAHFGERGESLRIK